MVMDCTCVLQFYTYHAEVHHTVVHHGNIAGVFGLLYVEPRYRMPLECTVGPAVAA